MKFVGCALWCVCVCFSSGPVVAICGKERERKNKSSEQMYFFCLELKRAQKSQHLSVSFLLPFLILIEDQRLNVT